MLTVPIAEVTWPMILVLVSLLSAAIGALFMVVFLHLKLRLSGRTAPSRPGWFRRKRGAVLPPDAVPSNQNAVRANHYTVEEAAAAIPVVVYASVISGGQDDGPHNMSPPSLSLSSAADDVLYTELDRVPTPAYHNAGYAFDQHSSAYYSDMYEPIDPYHSSHHHHQRQNSLPSDYV
ncbi:PREDICTED: uncharacterized protein LOC107171414, partial [Diuraphis noxia]|uniref:uncharacterized protein LOC107171414 n=1 Tax=Diuraphis noxia TaxID=143948 RepID=UPI000763AA97